jgi:hypothetical protein
MTKTWLEGAWTGGGRIARGAGIVGLVFFDLALVLLGKIAHDCLIGIQTVLGRIGVHEVLKGVTVVGCDSIKPSVLDREAQAGMIEPNQGPNAGEIKALWVNGVPAAQAARATAWAAPYR